jgi:hypothetical protein
LRDIQRTGLSSASGLFGNADCLVPGICAGDVFEPNTRITSCANKMAICQQVMKLDNIKAAAGVKAAQACNINFEAEQRKKDAAKAAARKRAADAAAARNRRSPAPSRGRSPAPSRGRSPSPSGGGGGGGETAKSVGKLVRGDSSLPGPLANVARKLGLSDTMVAIVSSMSVSCFLVLIMVLLLAGGGGGGGAPPAPRRYRG